MFLLLAFIVPVFQIRDGTFATPTQSMKSLEIYQDLDNFQNEALLSAIVQNLVDKVQHLDNVQYLENVQYIDNVQNADNVQYLDNSAQTMEQGNVMIITKSQIEQAKLVAHALQQKHKKGASDGRRFLGILYLCIVLPFFRFWFLSLLVTKLRNTKILCTLCLHFARQDRQDRK